jgi:hypothetical protein
MHGFIKQFADGVFEPDAVKILTGAFDDAWAKVQASNAPWAGDDYALAGRTIVAKHIIASARAGAGNLNQRALAEGALLYLAGQKLHRKPPNGLP